MKLGLSSYSFKQLLTNGTLTIDAMFDWLQANGAEHLEIATLSFAKAGGESGYDFASDADTLRTLADASARTAIPISGLCMGASFSFNSSAERREQIDLVKRHVDLCSQMGIGYLRHDVAPWSHRLKDEAEFEGEFAGIVEACQEIADFAAARSVVTSVENHGFFMNSSGRVNRLIHAVDRSNFGFTLDIGNFLCIDEDPIAATKAALPQARFVHFKDFYVRRRSPGPGWLETLGGQYIRGSVFGFGDLEAGMLIETVAATGYDGFVSLEYEGNEPSLSGCATGLENIRRLLGKVGV